MIRGLHGLFYSSEPEAARAFLRDKLALPHFDVGGGWLIFDLPESDLGVHPIEGTGGTPAGTHHLSFFCDDIQSTVAALRDRGVEFKNEVEDHGWGYVTVFAIPGGIEVQLYEPKYAKPALARVVPGKKAAKKKAAKKKAAAPKKASAKASAKKPAKPAKKAAKPPAKKAKATR